MEREIILKRNLNLQKRAQKQTECGKGKKRQDF